MCVCVCVCVYARALIYWAVLESNPRGNGKFCTRPAQKISCSEGNDYLYQVTAGRA